MTIAQAGRKLRAREVSAVELAQESLRRIGEAQPRFNAFVTVAEDLALEQARRADDEFARNIDRGPLQGIPYALKDNFDTRGIPTTCGSRIFADRIPDRDSAVYTQLTEAGAVLMGKTGMHEFAYGITSANSFFLARTTDPSACALTFGDIRNPHDPAHIPGGSSGGSGVAVTADLVFFAMGTDTGGSIRVPASYCGCVGFKPAYGTLSRSGVFPLGFSLDTVGPLTGTVEDTTIVMNALAGYRKAAQPTEKPRIGIPENFFNERIAAPVWTAFEKALDRARSIGCRLVPIRVPDPAALNTIGRLILLTEASAALQPYLNRRADFGADVLTLVEEGFRISGTDYVNAQRLRRFYQARWAQLWTEIDLVITPTTPVLAPAIGQNKVDDEDVRVASTRLVRPFNVLGLPALSIPVATGGLPAGVQLIGAPGREQALLTNAESFAKLLL